jgi:hypothetical protein
MDWKAYFETTEGMGILATSDKSGNVNAALYARPHVQEDGTIAFIMQPQLSYANLQINPKAVYLFLEKTEGYKGHRLYLVKKREESSPEAIQAARRSSHKRTAQTKEKAKLVFFQIDHVRPLIGNSAESW